MPEAKPGLVWARDVPAPRRRAPSVARIVAHAVAVADADGLAAVSMRRVAGDLGSGTASLYRYVTDRDELVDLMVDAVQGEDEVAAPTGDWRADLTAVADHLRAVLLRHPWLGAELTGRPNLGPHSLRRADSALAAAAALTGDPSLAAAAVDTVTAFVFGTVTTEVAELQARRRTGLDKEQWQASVAPYIRQVVAAGEHPHFARRVIEAEHLSPADRYAFGLGCVLDGLAARLGG